jgi:pyruvate ferredoxin oxidoreductase gamma subunit
MRWDRLLRGFLFMERMFEVTWHGLGGMGAVTSSDLFASAAISEGKYAQSFPSFGGERRGAPVMASLRINDEFIRLRGDIEHPDIVVVLALKVLNQVDVTLGLKENGKIIINSSRSPKEIRSEFDLKWPLATVDAFRIARQTIKLPIPNTAIMGAFQKATEVVKMDSLVEQVRNRFGKRAEANIEAMKRAYKETVMEE